MLEKTYNPADLEAKWYDHWESSGAFKPGRFPDAEPYTIVQPPPNVTGSLHIGHAFDTTLQDVLIRFERLRGRDVLWQPGVDHAGIATQNVVERQLDEEGLSRREMGREKFLERIWAWKEESGDLITQQLRRLGASCDWSRERFTMDPGFSKAVTKSFVDLHKAGLLYRDKRLVNWDPKLKTAISDLEVEARESDGQYWHFRYPVEGADEFICVATTRPETMLGDTAVAVHPDDKRYTHLVGQHVILPLVGRRIPIIADDWADPEQGSGAVKITPAHDFNDFEVGRRHDLPMVNIFDEEARITDAAPAAYRGLDRFEARQKVVEDLEAQGLVEKVEARRLTLPYGDRSGVVIEPWLTDQWFVDAPALAKEPIKAVEEGRTQFVPATWTKTFFEWMRNIQPWCVSRQLWWGHRIPAWYAPDGSIYVAESEQEAYAAARQKHGEEVTLVQDEDVLDTWFSSALWPFATLGWPEENAVLDRFYPGVTLVTGFDIIFFWVARMMMAGHFFMGDVPFTHVYIHALVRDEQGRKMSKSKGNAVDPLVFVDRYGADALRFTLAAMESQGRDIKLSEARVEGYRNFGTKLWNACRFAEINRCTGGGAGFDPANLEAATNQWIVGQVKETAERLTVALEAYRYDLSCDLIYHFTWGTFCDWYLELIKPVLQGEDSAAKEETQRCCAWVIDQILILLHPFMPFITEELWHALGERQGDLILETWPDLTSLPVNEAASGDIALVIDVISNIRSFRAASSVPAKAKTTAYVRGAEADRMIRYGELIMRLARLESLEEGEAAGEGVVRFLVENTSVTLRFEGFDVSETHRARLENSLDHWNEEISILEERLSNEQFRAKAKPEVVADAETRLENALVVKAKLEAALEQMG
ncbi:MAG: valine--tRNA ligase [Proteobacteria bacterium]|nr:valine--tRNA ligase [Pseudomonadota bacterium]